MFLPTGLANQSLEFIDTDSEELYRENLEQRPRDWHYRHQPVTYRFNELGYRCQTFQNIDWPESVVCLGCSSVFGTGLASEETVTHQLEQLLSRPVINLGVPGSSVWISYWNQLQLKVKNLEPWAVVNFWTDTARLALFKSQGYQNLGPWSDWRGPEPARQLWRAWCQWPDHSDHMALMIKQSAKQLWRHGRYLEYTVFEHTHRLFGCELLKRSDLARDQSHAGRQSHSTWALKIARNLDSAV